MKPIYLERHESDKNLHRFYQLHVMPGIFGDWALVREWGRVGSPGTVRKDWFASEAEVINAVQKLCDAKQKKGYQPRRNVARSIKLFFGQVTNRQNKLGSAQKTDKIDEGEK